MVNQQFAIAVHVMTSLAYLRNLQIKGSSYEHKYLVNSKLLARSVQTNPVVIRRIIRSLTQAGLVQTSRGKTGGICLTKEPYQISLKDVYLALHIYEPIAPHNKEAHKDCPVSCSMHKIMSTVAEGAQKSLNKYLESQKLSDLLKKVK